MLKWFMEKLTGKAAQAAVGTAVDAAAGAATGGATIWVRIVLWCLNNPFIILFGITTIVFSIMYGCERMQVNKLKTTVEQKDHAIALAAMELAKMVQTVETCQKSVETYKGSFTACEEKAKKQQLAYGDLISIIQSKCVTQQKIDDAVKKAEQQKKTTGTYTAAELVSIYNDMIKARAAAIPKPPAPAGGVR